MRHVKRKRGRNKSEEKAEDRIPLNVFFQKPHASEDDDDVTDVGRDYAMRLQLLEIGLDS